LSPVNSRCVHSCNAILLVSTALLACASTPAAELESVRLEALPANVHVSRDDVLYKVSGVNVAELRQSMRQTGPAADGRRYAGYTRWETRWTYAYDRASGPCTLRDLQVYITARVDLPQWADQDAADAETRAWWRDYRARLVAHEQDHVQSALNAGRDAVRELSAITGPECEGLASRVDATGKAIIARARARDIEIDRGAKHDPLPR
jgi:predicted secreted Zn-dependent protease